MVEEALKRTSNWFE